MAKLVTGILLLMSIPAVGLYFLLRTKAVDPEHGLEFAGPFISVEADQLLKDFEANEKDAIDRYQGKGVEITGAVRAVIEPIGGGYDKDSTIHEVGSVENLIYHSGISRERTVVIVMGRKLGVVFFSPETRRILTGLGGVKHGDVLTLKGVCAGIPPYSRTKSIFHVMITGARRF